MYVNRVGAIYVADYTRIQKWAGATSGTTVAGGNGSGTNPNQFQSTRSVFVDEENGDVYVADGGWSRIQKWAVGATAGITVAGGSVSGSGPNQLLGPSGVYVDRTGAVYVSDQYNNRVQKFTPR